MEIHRGKGHNEREHTHAQLSRRPKRLARVRGEVHTALEAAARSEEYVDARKRDGDGRSDGIGEHRFWHRSGGLIGTVMAFLQSSRSSRLTVTRSPASLPIAFRRSPLIGSLCVPSPSAMNEVSNE
jgi:hypothetical protein